MRVGIIDLGTNSVRFDVHQITANGKVHQLHREKLMIRLGQGVFLDGKLDKNAIRRALHAFSSFKKTAEKLHVSRIVAFGTSALREASDSKKLLTMISARTGIEVRVISGEEEARLIAQGILNHERPRKGFYGLVDIGGGSTEINICRGRQVLHSASFPLGTARLQQVFLKGSPPKPPSKGDPGAIKQMRQYIKGQLLPKMIAEDWKHVELVVGSSGTIRALGRLLKKSSKTKSFSKAQLEELVDRLSTMTTTQLLGIPAMEAKRVDMILAGAVLFDECMRALRAKRVEVTEFSLRDGILDEEVQLLEKHEKSHIPIHLRDLYAKAKRFGCDPGHLKQIVDCAEFLFDRLASLHKLKSHWKVYLTAAAIMKNTGEAISVRENEVHSHYIVMNADLPGVEKWEAEFVAELCFWMTGGKPPRKELPFSENKQKRQAFFKLLALLRIADALDVGSVRKQRIQSIQNTRKSIILNLAPRLTTELELLRIDQKKSLFEDIFAKTLIAKRA